MDEMGTQITSLTIFHLTVYSGTDQRTLRVTGLCEGNWPVSSSHKVPVTRKMFPFDDVIMLIWKWVPTCSMIEKLVNYVMWKV